MWPLKWVVQEQDPVLLAKSYQVCSGKYCVPSAGAAGVTITASLTHLAPLRPQWSHTGLDFLLCWAKCNVFTVAGVKAFLLPLSVSS